MMRASILALLITWDAPAWSLDAPPAQDAAAGQAERGPSVARPAVTVPPEAGAPPAATFTPSEKISADSAVSFPVDI